MSISGNTAKKDGGQVYSTCAGDLAVENTTVGMAVGDCVASQVCTHVVAACVNSITHDS